MANENADKNDLEKLTEMFREAGASEPESWARSQISEGIPQLARFSFLKAISSILLKEDELEWLNSQLNHNYREVNEPGSQIVDSLKEIVSKGVRKEAIIDLVRVVQWETLFHACATVDGVYELDTPITQWGLFQLDEDCNPIKQINGLHESLLEFDPSRKEMRPRENEGNR